MNSSVMFLAGAGGLAVTGSLLLWLFSRPRKVLHDPNEFRNTLRGLHKPGVGTSRSGPATQPNRVVSDKNVAPERRF
jgi:hypothetical protein